MKQNSLKIGDHVLVTMAVEREFNDVWVGIIETFDSYGVLIRNISHPAHFYTKIPISQTSILTKIEPEKVQNQIKIVKLLFYD